MSAARLGGTETQSGTTKGEEKIRKETVRVPGYTVDKLYEFPYSIPEWGAFTFHPDEISGQGHRHCDVN